MNQKKVVNANEWGEDDGWDRVLWSLYSKMENGS